MRLLADDGNESSGNGLLRCVAAEHHAALRVERDYRAGTQDVCRILRADDDGNVKAQAHNRRMGIHPVLLRDDATCALEQREHIIGRLVDDENVPNAAPAR